MARRRKTQPEQRPTFFTQQQTAVEVVNAPKDNVSDLYQAMLASSWKADFLVIAFVYFALNLLFGALFALVGGVHGARPGSFADGFFFSIQTLGTIGYGAMYPESGGANVLVSIESFIGLVIVAVATGLIFAKFSVPRARVLFSRQAVISPLDGMPTLMFRVANQRGNHVVEAQIRVVLMRTEVTAEGQTLYRMHDLNLVRDRSPAFIRTWTVMHPITDFSPLKGATPDSLKNSDAEIIVTLIGIDGTTSQTLHAGHSYIAEEVLFGHRHADILSDLPDGRTRLDFGKFHDTVHTPKIDGFPFGLG